MPSDTYPSKLSLPFLPALEQHIPVVQKPTKISLQLNTPIPQDQRIRFRLAKAPGLPALLPGAVILGSQNYLKPAG